MTWLKLYSDLPYEAAMRKARKIQSDEAKRLARLRTLRDRTRKGEG